MATEYISREAAIEALCKAHSPYPRRREISVRAIQDISPADVVTREAFNRILAENDDMREQLAAIGKKPGDDMDDVQRVVLSRWIEIDDYVLCANCGAAEHSPNRNYCHACGSDMRKVVEIDQVKEDAE